MLTRVLTRAATRVLGPAVNRRRWIVRGRARLDETAVGPKFARQARMAASGIPVPDFFCLSADVFRQVLAPRGPAIRDRLQRLDYDDPARLAEQSEDLMRLVVEAPIPDRLRDQLSDAFDAAFGADAVVSVRSSMVSAHDGESEDSADDAFAGISDSFLYVRRGQLLERVRQCWASAYSSRSLLYRKARGVAPLGFAISVGVQRMVFGRRSFVLFTCDPKTGARDAVLAACLGIGEGVVQEKVPVDHYFVDRASGEVSSHIAHKTERMEQDPADPSLGPVVLPVDPPQQDQPALTEEQIQRVLRMGERIECLFGGPQDIEGTIGSDGALHILQSRPIVLDWDRQRLWSNANITESYPGVTTALTYSFAQRFYREIFYDFYRRLGVRPATLDRHEADLQGMIGLQRGRVYYSLTAWYRLHRQSPLFPAWRPHWERMMGLERSAPDARPDVVDPRPAALPALAAATGRAVVLWAGHGRYARGFHAWWDSALAARRAGAAEADSLRLVQELRGLWREVAEHWGTTLVNDVLLTTTAGATAELFARWLPDAEPGLLSDLLCGGEENRSVTILMSMVALAEQVRALPELMETLETKPAEEVWPQVERGGYGAELARGMRHHVHAHGDRGLQELKLECPGPRQQPGQLLRLVGDYARTEMTVRDLRAREDGTRQRAEVRLDRLLAGRPVRRRVLRTLLAQQRRYIKFREDSRYCRSELFGFAKQVFGALGDELAARGALDRPGDVVHLTQEEVLGYFDGTGVTDDLRGLVEVRRGEYRDRGAELPMHFATVGPVRDGLPAAQHRTDGAAGLRGLGSSGGVARGTARVVLDPHEPVEPCDDMILVARETDSGWMFLMLAARGIVVERGTMLSHTAISGRKFGIPTIVSLPHATSRIPDGARIEMDGAAGTVVLLEEENQ